MGKGCKPAVIPVTPLAREAWNRLSGVWPIGQRGTQRRFEKVGFHPHQLRHWRATSLLQAGVELGTVSEIMRHANMETTKVYAAFNVDMLEDALTKVQAGMVLNIG